MKSRGRELNAGKLHARKEEGCRNLKMDEFSAGIQGPGGNAGEQSGERSEIEIFDFVNQKPDLTTMDKGLFIESGARNLPKRTQDPGEPGPRYENAWEEIELRDTERRAEEKRRAESVKKKRLGTRSTEGGNGKKHRSGARGTGAGDGKKRTAGNHGSETGRKHANVKRAGESGKSRVSGKRRVQRAGRMRRERAVRIRIVLIAALVLICVLAGIFFARKKREDTAIPVTVRREPAAFVSIPEELSGRSAPAFLMEEAYLWE